MSVRVRFAKKAIGDNAFTRVKTQGRALARMEAQEGLDSGLAEGGTVSQFDTGGNIIMAGAYPGVGHISWLTDDAAKVVARLLGFRDLALATTADGIVVAGFAKEAGHIGLSALAAGDESDALVNTFNNILSVRSDGTTQLDSSAVAAAAGAQGLRVITLTSATNVPNDVLYLVTRTSGAPAAGLGTGLYYGIEDSAGNDQQAGSLGFEWVSPTDGAETAALRAFLVENGSGSEYPVLNPVTLTADNLRTTISTVGETTVFSEAVIANFSAADGKIFKFKTIVYIDTNANARILTGRFKVGSTTITMTQSNAGNKEYGYVIEGWVSRGGTDVQDVHLEMRRHNITDVADNLRQAVAAAAEDDAAAITIAFTLQLAGSVDAGYFMGYEAVQTGDE